MLVNAKDNDGRTALIWASSCNRGCEGIVNLLLAREDVEANVKDNDGNTVLTHAVRSSHNGIAKHIRQFIDDQKLG